MLFFRKVDPNRFPFVIEEGPLLLEGTGRKDNGIFDELKAIKEQVVTLRAELLGKIDPLESTIVESKRVIADLSKGSPEMGKEEDKKNDELAKDILLVMDGLDACLKFTPQISEDNIYRELLEKIKLVHLKLGKVFKRFNISQIPSIGREFDSKIHIPVGIKEESGLPNYVIAEEKLAGYTLNGRVIRHAEVIVAKSD